jgi:hypothetical protein
MATATSVVTNGAKKIVRAVAFHRSARALTSSAAPSDAATVSGPPTRAK